MQEAGYGPDNPITLELRYNTSENHRKVALAIADMWAPLGVEVELLNSDVATHYAYLRDGGEFQVARAGWIADYNDPQNFLFMVESDNDGFNYAKYDNPEYDALMDEAAATTDLEARAEVLAQAEELFMRDLPFIPIYHYVNLELVSEDIDGWVQNVQGRHRSQYVTIN
jgi:oligopeptide transport system substrate-binding protein